MGAKARRLTSATNKAQIVARYMIGRGLIWVEVENHTRLLYGSDIRIGVSGARTTGHTYHQMLDALADERRKPILIHVTKPEADDALVIMRLRDFVDLELEVTG